MNLEPINRIRAALDMAPLLEGASADEIDAADDEMALAVGKLIAGTAEIEAETDRIRTEIASLEAQLTAADAMRRAFEHDGAGVQAQIDTLAIERALAVAAVDDSMAAYLRAVFADSGRAAFFAELHELAAFRGRA